MPSLAGRVAFVTGGASGIGKACCLRFAEEGADVAIADLNLAGAEAVVAEIEGMGRRALALALDVADEAAVEAAVERAVQQFGKVDACVANAGIGFGAAVVDMTLEGWQRVLDVTLHGVMYTDRAVARQLIAAGLPGTIVNMASGAAKVPMRNSAAYCCAKAGVVMLTRTLGVELARHEIRVNAIAPGPIETPATAPGIRDNPRRLAAFMRGQSLRRMGQPREVADTALFLSSDASSYYTSHVLTPAGGAFLF